MAHDLIPADVRSRLKDLRLTARRAIGAQGIGNRFFLFDCP